MLVFLPSLPQFSRVPNRAHINPFLPNQIFAQSGDSEGNWLFLYKGCIIRLDELGQIFVVRLVLCLKYKDGHKTHYASRLTTLRSASFKTYYEGKFVQASERGTLLAVSRSGYI